MKDLLLVFTDRAKVAFKSRDGTTDVETGRWCKECK